MGEGKQLLLGFEITNESSQKYFFQTQAQDAVPIFMTQNQSNPLFPTCLAVKESTKEWLLGEEAIRLVDLGEAVLVDNLLKKVENQESITVYGTSFTPEMLLTKFFKRAFMVVRQQFLNSSIQKLVITIPNLTAKTTELIYLSLEELGLLRDRVYIISQVQSYMYYVLSQKPEIWAHDVSLFTYDETGLFYYNLSVNRRMQPYAVLVNRMDLSNELTPELFEQEPLERVLYRLEKIMNQVLYKRLTSAVFVTGKGFEGNWVRDVLIRLSSSRRVFLGQNLYAKGACLAAKGFLDDRFLNYLFLGDEMITSTISLRVYENAKEVDFCLVKAGTPWWKANNTVTVILDQTKELAFTVTNLLKREPLYEVLSLDGLLERENKTIRLSITVHFIDRFTAIVTVRDVGFGVFYETNYRIWEQVLTL